MTGLQLLSLWNFHHVQKNQVHNELAVEKIVRQRSLDGEDAVHSHMHWFLTWALAFQSRCQYFSPPLTDAEARKWWNAAHTQDSL